MKQRTIREGKITAVIHLKKIKNPQRTRDLQQNIEGKKREFLALERNNMNKDPMNKPNMQMENCSCLLRHKSMMEAIRGELKGINFKTDKRKCSFHKIN